MKTKTINIAYNDKEAIKLRQQTKLDFARDYYSYIWDSLWYGNYDEFSIIEVNDKNSDDYGLWLVDIIKQKYLFHFNEEWQYSLTDEMFNEYYQDITLLVAQRCVIEMDKSKRMSNNNPELFQVMFPGM